jgi:short-subunit dehydrogenase
MALPTPRPDHTALVTGASSGIGAAVARQLAQRGHGLTLVARRAPLLEALADELRSEYDVKVNVASTAGFQPLPWSAGYSAAKAHAVTFSEALHEEVGSRGIAVTALCPGPVRTEFWENAPGQPMKQALPRPMWVSTSKVAAAGIRGLERGRRVVVPGLAVQLSSFGSRWTPHAIQLPMTRRAMHP